MKTNEKNVTATTEVTTTATSSSNLEKTMFSIPFLLNIENTTCPVGSLPFTIASLKQFQTDDGGVDLRLDTIPLTVPKCVLSHSYFYNAVQYNVFVISKLVINGEIAKLEADQGAAEMAFKTLTGTSYKSYDYDGNDDGALRLLSKIQDLDEKLLKINKVRSRLTLVAADFKEALENNVHKDDVDKILAFFENDSFARSCALWLTDYKSYLKYGQVGNDTKLVNKSFLFVNDTKTLPEVVRLLGDDEKTKRDEGFKMFREFCTKHFAAEATGTATAFYKPITFTPKAMSDAMITRHWANSSKNDARHNRKTGNINAPKTKEAYNLQKNAFGLCLSRLGVPMED